MQNYKLLTCDLDGTLLRNDMTLSNENKQAITALSQKNLFFVPCSGRTFSEIPPEVRNHPNIRYMIHSDGAVILDNQTNKRITACISRELCADILDILADYEVFFTVHYLGDSYVDETQKTADAFSHYRVTPYFAKLIEETSIPSANFEKFCRYMEEVELFCVFFRHPGQLLECKRRLEKTEGLQIVSSDPANLEIIAKNAGKGNALLRLAKELEIDPNETIAIGDSPNDGSMIGTAGLGLAVKNACEELQEIAKDRICSNEEHVAKYVLEKIIL